MKGDFVVEFSFIFYFLEKKWARIFPHPSCFHNGIILIVNCFQL